MNRSPGLGVVTTDRDLVVRSWNEWLVSATGIAEQTVLGRSLLDYVAPERVEWCRELFNDVLASGTARVLAPAFHHYLIACPPQMASEHFAHMQQRVTVAPLAAAAKVVGVMVTIEDVTERLEYERSLSAQLQEQPSLASSAAAIAAVGADDWQLRGAAVRALRQSASRDDVRHLLASLQRDHQDLNVLSSALQVLIGSERDVIAPLVELLSDREPNLRMHAALALGQLKATAAAAPLVRALDDADENVRFHAIEALGQIGAPDAVEPLVRIAESGDFFLAFPAIDALARTDDAQVAPGLTRLLGNELLRPAAIDTLAALGDEDCVPDLIGVINETGAETARIAAAVVRIYDRYEQTMAAGGQIVDLTRAALSPEGIGRLAAAIQRREAPLSSLAIVAGWIGAEALTPLLSLVGQSDVEAPVGDALVAIGSDAVEPLIARLAHEDRDVRLSAAALLGRLGDRRAAPSLIAALRSADASLVNTAAAALAGLGDGRALPELLPLFAHPQASVRQAAVAAVNSIGAEGTAAEIRRRLDDADPRVRESAVRVAGYFGFAGSIAGVLHALDDEHEDVRRAAIEQLPVLDDPRAVTRLLDAVRSETPRNRAAAAHALRAVEPPIARDVLIAALADTDTWVRYFAAGSLGRCRDRSAASELMRVTLNDLAMHVRIAAVQALGETGDSSAVTVAQALLDADDEDLACAAIVAAGRVGDDDGDALLEQTVRTSYGARRAAAVQALSRRTSRRAAEVLAWAARIAEPPALTRQAIDGLRFIAAAGQDRNTQTIALTALLDLGTDPSMRDAAIRAFAGLPPQAVPVVAEALTSPRVALRLIAVEALAIMRHPRASEEIRRALDDEAPAVRSAAVIAFGRLGTPAAARLIASMRLGDPDPAVRRRAVAACERHGWGPGPTAVKR
jgi:HEAT repeat protein